MDIIIICTLVRKVSLRVINTGKSTSLHKNYIVPWLRLLFSSAPPASFWFRFLQASFSVLVRLRFMPTPSVIKIFDLLCVWHELQRVLILDIN